jgi:hypothetical protein
MVVVTAAATPTTTRRYVLTSKKIVLSVVTAMKTQIQIFWNVSSHSYIAVKHQYRGRGVEVQGCFEFTVCACVQFPHIVFF